MIDKFFLACALSLFYTEICHWFIQQIYLACLFVSGYKTLVLDGFSAKRLHLATSLIDRSSNQREPSGGLNRPWRQQRGRKPEGLEEASDSPGVWFGTSFCLYLPSGPHRGRDCGQVLSQTTVLGRTSPLKAAQHWAECGEGSRLNIRGPACKAELDTADTPIHRLTSRSECEKECLHFCCVGDIGLLT